MSINLLNYALAKKDWEKAYGDLKVLGVSGRNLLPNSDFSQGIKHWGVSGSTYTISGNEITVTSDDNGSWPRLYVISDTINSIKKGEVYTLSFEAKGHNSNPRTWRISESTGSNVVYSSPDITYTNEWKRYVYTFTAENDANDYTRLEFWIDGHQTSGRNSRSYRNIKLEKGNKATDWTPASEDINAHPLVVELAETVFRSKQNDLEKAYEDLKVLGVGGRNLIRDTSDKNKTVSWSGWDYRLVDVTNIEDIGLSVGDTIVFRVYIEETNMPVRAFTEFYVLDDEGEIDYRPKNGNIIYEGESGWSEVKLTISEEDVKNLVQFKVAIRNTNNSDATVTYRKAKLEIGNEATDWTPAPEDINAHPFVAELAENMFRSKQNEERIRNLENAIVALGGGS